MTRDESISEQVFHILLSLVDGPRHGYGIIQDVDERTRGHFLLGSGTLYSAIKRLTADGWVKRVATPKGADARRKYYGLTDEGSRAVHKEAQRLAALVRYARAKDLLTVRAT
jgi:DNA-binding PadR family transcriptional regulator